MNQDIVYRLRQAINQAQERYHRLVLLVGPPGSGKTAALQQLAQHIEAPRINVNLELSRRLLDLTEKQRALETLLILRSLVQAPEAEVVLLDNLEMLFGKELKQEPLALLQNLSRNQLIVAAWSGRIEGRDLVYAEPSHHEFRRYTIRDFLVVPMGVQD